MRLPGFGVFADVLEEPYPIHCSLVCKVEASKHHLNHQYEILFVPFDPTPTVGFLRRSVTSVGSFPASLERIADFGTLPHRRRHAHRKRPTDPIIQIRTVTFRIRILRIHEHYRIVNASWHTHIRFEILGMDPLSGYLYKFIGFRQGF